MGGWPSFVNGGCRFALQSRSKFIDQVRILAKSRIRWNHGRILLVPGPGEIFFSTFGVNMDLILDPSIWKEPCFKCRGLERPGVIQPGMLDFSTRTVQSSMLAKLCVILGRSQRSAILEWSLVNREKISEFLNRMKTDLYFQNYYLGLYGSLRLLHQRIFDRPSVAVTEAEKKWSSKLDNVLEQERKTLERCEDEIVIQRERVAYLE